MITAAAGVVRAVTTGVGTFKSVTARLETRWRLSVLLSGVGTTINQLSRFEQNFQTVMSENSCVFVKKIVFFPSVR